MKKIDSLKALFLNEGKSAGVLRKELLGYGGNPEGLSVDELELELAKVHWKLNNPNDPFPDQFRPMTAQDATGKDPTWVKKNVHKGNYFLQRKANGMRSVLSMDQQKIVMTSRSPSVKNYMLPRHDRHVLGFRNFRNPFSKKTVIDGELMAPHAVMDTGKTITASPLQAVVALVHMDADEACKVQEKYGSLIYHAFDILYYEGESVMDMPYDERIDVLEKAVHQMKAMNADLPISLIPVIKDYEDPDKVFQDHVDRGEEGIMLKHRKGTYALGKRVHDILKYKRELTVDGWITGWTPATEGRGNEKFIGGFEISAYVDDKPQIIAAVSNMKMDLRKEATIYDENGKPTLNPDFIGRVVEVAGQEFGKGGRLMHARFGDWRPDKSASHCRLTADDIKVREHATGK